MKSEELGKRRNDLTDNGRKIRVGGSIVEGTRNWMRAVTSRWKRVIGTQNTWQEKSRFHSIYSNQRLTFHRRGEACWLNKSFFIIITILIKLNTLKVIGFVELRTTSLMLKAHNNQLPYCIQETLLPRVSHCNLRGTNMFETITVRTNFRSGCISVKGVKLWNSLCDEFTTSTSVPKFQML